MAASWKNLDLKWKKPNLRDNECLFTKKDSLNMNLLGGCVVVKRNSASYIGIASED